MNSMQGAPVPTLRGSYIQNASTWSGFLATYPMLGKGSGRRVDRSVGAVPRMRARDAAKSSQKVGSRQAPSLPGPAGP